MSYRSLLLFCGATLAICATNGSMVYPIAPKSDQVDDYHGTKISDPYRELENADSPATQKWIAEENALTFGYLAKIPARSAIRSRLEKLWDYEKYGGMWEAGGHFFYTHNSGLQNQSVVYVQDRLDAPARVLIDPNSYRADGTAALSGDAVSWDGKYFAYGVAQAGSDWSDWHVREIATGKDLSDEIHWSKGGVAWSGDNQSFFYTRFPEPPPDKLLTAEAKNEQIYFHKLGDPQSADKLIYSRSDQPGWLFGNRVSKDGRFLVVEVNPLKVGTTYISYADLSAPDPKVVDLISHGDFDYTFIGSVGSTFYIATTDGAPRGRVIAVDVKQPDRASWKEIVPQQEATLESAVMGDGKLILSYLKDAHSVVRLESLDGHAGPEIQLPGLGSVFVAEPDRNSQQTFYTYTGFTTPPVIYHLSLETGKSEAVHRSHLDFDPNAFETTQVFYKSKDGTKVPMFLISKKGLQRNGQNPTLLYGYGGFQISLTPSFNPAVIEWIKMGGVYAVANLRGGSEYGEAWHQAGMKEHKQNVFDDFIAAAEYLIDSKYTSRQKLAIFGASNGGLLVGAVLNQRPDLFAAAMPAVGVMDMLRFQNFGFGGYWVGEYGTSANAEDFKTLIKYSPLHNIKVGAHYPPTLITTSDHDDRVMPGHSLKYAATLQQAQGGSAPILIRVETRAGHGAGKPTSKLIDEWADRLAFLSNALGMTAVAGD